MKVATLEEIWNDMKHGVYDFTVNGECSCCGNCCSNMLPITKAEANRIEKYVKEHGIKEQTHFTAPMAVPGYDMVCPFRNNAERRCEIYPVRPAICREFRCDYPSKGKHAKLAAFKSGVGDVLMRETFFPKEEKK